MAIVYVDPGQVNGSGDKTALFIENWNTDVQRQFDRMKVMEKFVWRKSITQGDSESWPWIWGADADYFARAGTLEGQASKQAKRVITIYRPILSDQIGDKFDDMLIHYDNYGPLRAEMALALSKIWDKNCILEGLIGANTSANNPVTGNPGGYRHVDAALGSTNPQECATALYNAAQELAIKYHDRDVPYDQRYVIIKPKRWEWLAGAIQDNGIAVQNADYTDMELNRATGEIRIGSMKYIYSNNFPEGEDLSANTDKYQYHQFDATNSIGLGLTPNSIGYLERMGIFSEEQYRIELQGNHLVTGYFGEPGWVRNDVLMELATA